MKNVKTLIKNNIDSLFYIFILLLSVIGISIAIAALRIDRYDNPLLKILPISSVLWILFIIFVKVPQEITETDEEISNTRKFYALPSRREISPLLEMILRKVFNLLMFICVLIPLTCFFMTFLIAGKIDVSRFHCFP